MNSYFFFVEDDFLAVFFAVPQGPFDLHAISVPPSLKCYFNIARRLRPVNRIYASESTISFQLQIISKGIGHDEKRHRFAGIIDTRDMNGTNRYSSFYVTQVNIVTILWLFSACLIPLLCSNSFPFVRRRHSPSVSFRSRYAEFLRYRLNHSNASLPTWRRAPHRSNTAAR
jgi:hypothetical protein